MNNIFIEETVDAMVDLWVKDGAPQWIRDYIKEELKKQCRLKTDKRKENGYETDN